ncbi:hypothetical protein BJ986_002254 [Phycicoccus badiiscoriae]|uniref:GIY-YIG domain-containing protein n=1 Tax=Pedococcus badiiscoriae TaxID=642776 RepID=A0A852WEW0_9MICO|nr:GIY-YIG nuclease family protein [Pedococcus badiiscoriae]NYG07767.1 hypothetical protein [Pedococcus badiiscoriae]
MFWLREEVQWDAHAWQLLGRRGVRRPKLEACDFRRAKGFYILFDGHGPTYVGLADSSQGLGTRLRRHHKDRDNWSRFCWFAFDDVERGRLDGWSHVVKRDALGKTTTSDVIRECEALLITVLGTHRTVGPSQRYGQNRMEFQAAGEPWEQLRQADFAPGEIARNVERSPFTDQTLFNADWG